MNFRTHWKKFALAATAFFWTSCSESDNSVATSNEIPGEESSSSVESSSSEPVQAQENCEVSTEQVSRYPSCQCDESNLQCVCPDYGVMIDQATIYTCDGVRYTEEEYIEKFGKPFVPGSSSSEALEEKPIGGEFDAPIAVYGPPCYFAGNCDEEQSSKNPQEE